MKKEYLILDYPWTLNFLASKNAFRTLIKATPILLFFLFISYSTFNLFSLALVFSGAVYWSLFEYCVHRWLYHTHFKSKRVRWVLGSLHMFHHNNISDDRILNAGFGLIYPLVFLLLVPCYYLTGLSLSEVSQVGLGLVSYYCFYEFVHYYIHYKLSNRGYLTNIQKYHLHHHYNDWNKNFGNTITIWDRVFGTYDHNYKNLVYTEEQLQNFLIK